MTAEEGSEDSNLRLVELAGEGAGAGESDDHGVTTVVRNALLTTVVLGLVLTGSRLLDGRGRDVVEELAHPLGELAVVGAVGYDGEVWLRVGDLGEVFDGVGVEVLGVGRGRSGGSGDAESAVEGKAVDGVGGHVGDAGEEALVGGIDQREDLLRVDVGCVLSIHVPW